MTTEVKTFDGWLPGQATPDNVATLADMPRVPDVNRTEHENVPWLDLDSGAYEEALNRVAAVAERFEQATAPSTTRKRHRSR